MNDAENIPVVQGEISTEVVPWLKPVVIAQLAGMVALGLPGMPSGMVRMANGEEVDVMALTADAWVQAIIGYYRELDPNDVPRLREGFIAMANRARFWPKPVDLWACVPEREESPDVIDQRFQRELARMKEVERKLAAPPAKPEPENKPANPNPTPEEIAARRDQYTARFRALGSIRTRPAGMDPVDFMRTESERKQEVVA